MIKKIIFDVDNTLLDSEKDCLNAYIKYYHNEEIAKRLYDILEEYDKDNRNFEKNDVVNFVNERLGFNFTNDDFDKIFEIYRHEATIYPNVKEVLEQLSKDYNLATLSRGYKKDQEERLKTAGIDKYFSNIYGFENAGIKPSKSSFAIASANANIEECLVVGDSFESDYLIPREIGMESVLLNKDGKEIDCDYITDLNQIFDYLERGKRL